MSNDHFMFVRPETQLPPYFKDLCNDLRKHGFCRVHDEAMMEISKPDVNVGALLQQFQEAMRWISIEMDQNLLIDGNVMAPDILIALAPKNHPGTLPEVYKEDPDGKGVHDPEPIALPDPDGEQLEIPAKFNT